jgi:hypothetical protein
MNKNIITTIIKILHLLVSAPVDAKLVLVSYAINQLTVLYNVSSIGLMPKLISFIIHSELSPPQIVIKSYAVITIHGLCPILCNRHPNLRISCHIAQSWVEIARASGNQMPWSRAWGAGCKCEEVYIFRGVLNVLFTLGGFHYELAFDDYFQCYKKRNFSPRLTLSDRRLVLVGHWLNGKYHSDGSVCGLASKLLEASLRQACTQSHTVIWFCVWTCLKISYHDIITYANSSYAFVESQFRNRPFSRYYVPMII